MTSNTNAIEALVQALGSDLVAVGDGIPDRRHADWSGVPASVPLALLRPRTTEQLADMLRICNQHGQTVVPQGGLTGLAGGACCGAGDVAVSLERMSAIEELDPVSGTLTVQAGCVLQTVQEAAEDAGFLFPLDLGARGSCTIGESGAIDLTGWAIGHRRPRAVPRRSRCSPPSPRLSSSWISDSHE